MTHNDKIMTKDYHFYIFTTTVLHAVIEPRAMQEIMARLMQTLEMELQ